MLSLGWCVAFERAEVTEAEREREIDECNDFDALERKVLMAALKRNGERVENC